MKRSAFILAFLSAFLLAGCHTPKTATQVVTQSVHDTLYLNKLQYDSIFIAQEHYIDKARDTILIKNSTVEYRYRLLRDTICKTEIDSIPVVREVEVTHEVERPLGWFDHLCRWCFVFVIVILLTELLKFILSYKTQIMSIIHKL